MKKLNQLEKLRNEIDKINSKLVKVIAKRFKITDKIKRFKVKNNLLKEDKNRESEIMKEIEKLAENNKLNPQLLKEILRIIIEEVKK